MGVNFENDLVNNNNEIKKIDNIKENDKELTIEDIINNTLTWKKFSNEYAELLYSDLKLFNEYNPPSGKIFMQDVNYNPQTATQTELTTWLQDPANYEENLKNVSQYLESAIMQYKRTLNHFGHILTFRNELISLDSPEQNQINTWKSGYKRCLNWLSKFNLKYQKNLIMDKLMSEGGYFAYLSENNNFNTLIELPSSWCYITGRTDIGWTYAIDLTYFDKYQGMLETMPELVSYYKKFVMMRDKKSNNKKSNLFSYQYYPVPFDKGYVFCIDLLRAEITPPFKGVFKDAMSILDYKNLIKQKVTLDTWKMIAQIIPKTKDNEPAIDPKIASLIVQKIQTGLPVGVKTFATPLDVQELNFNNAQNMNNIVGTGEQFFWASVGVNGVLMNGAEKTVEAVRSSLKNDVGFVEYIYTQFENFINIQLYKQSKSYRFRIKIFGDRYTDFEERKSYSELVKGVNFPVSKLFAYCNYEPYEIDGLLTQEKIMNYKDRLEPIVSAFNTKGFTGKDDIANKQNDAGRPKNELETESSEITKTYQSNER